MAESFDTELLIEEVKKFNELWDIKSDKYHDKNLKRGAWRRICISLYPDFQDKTQKEREEISNKMMSKWRNVRDTFMKHMRKRKRSEADTSRQYVYARQLSFLLYNTPAEPESSMLNDDPTEDVEERLETGPPDEKRRKTGSPTRQNVEENLSRFINTPVIESNPYMAFFESLRPALDAFTIDQQLQFQTEVLNIVKTIRAQTGPHSLAVNTNCK